MGNTTAGLFHMGNRQINQLAKMWKIDHETPGREAYFCSATIY